MKLLSALLTLCEGNPPVISGSPSQRASDAELWCFSDVNVNNCWISIRETGELNVLRVIWHHCNNIKITGLWFPPTSLKDCLFNSLRPSDPYMHWWTNHHWFRWWLVAWLTPTHYLNQCWNIVNWTLWNKIKWNLNHKTIHIFSF